MYKHSNINPNYIPTGNVFEQPHCKYLATSTDTVSQLRIVRERKRQREEKRRQREGGRERVHNIIVCAVAGNVR